MPPCPCLLHEFIIGVNVPCLMSQFLQVSRIKVCPAKETLRPHPHLFFIALVFQTWILTVEPIQEVGIVRTKQEKPHNWLSLRLNSDSRELTTCLGLRVARLVSGACSV